MITSKRPEARAFQRSVMSIEVTPNQPVGDAEACNATTRSFPVLENSTPSAKEMEETTLEGPECVKPTFSRAVARPKRKVVDGVDSDADTVKKDYIVPEVVPPPIILPGEYYVNYSTIGNIQWQKYGIFTQIGETYLCAGENSAKEMADILGKSGCCLPLDFKVMFFWFFKASGYRASSGERERPPFVHPYFIWMAQRQPVYVDISNGSIIDQKSVLRIGEKKELIGNTKRKTVVETLFPQYVHLTPLSTEPRDTDLELHLERQDNCAYNGSAFLPSAKKSKQEEKAKRVSQRTSSNRQRLPQAERGGTCSTAQNSTSSNVRGTGVTPRKKTYADSVQELGSEVRYQRWLDSNFPAFPSQQKATELDEEKLDPDVSIDRAWKETRDSLVFHPSSSIPDNIQKTSQQKIPPNSASKPFARPEQTVLDSAPQMAEGSASNLVPSGARATNKIEKTSLEKSPDINQESSEDFSQFEQVTFSRHRNKHLKNLRYKEMTPDLINYLLEADLDLPYKPKRGSKAVALPKHQVLRTKN